MVLVLSAHFWLYFLTPVNITDAETDNIDENPLFDDENQHVLEIYQSLMWTIPFLEKLKKKLKEVATELLKNWEERQTKTILQATTFEVFGTIHEINDQDPIQHGIILRLLKKVVSSLPQGQK